MPTYEYQCDKCGSFEISQRISDEPLKNCPTCGGSVKRLVSAPAFHLKGSGWYKTDYGSGSSGGKEGGNKASSGKDVTGKNDTGKNETTGTGSEAKSGTETKSEAPKKSHGCGSGSCGCS